MNVLRKSDRDTYDRRRIHDQQMHESSMYTQQENIGDDDHDDGMAEWIDDWFGNMEHVSTHEQFLRAEATKKLYSGCSLTRLSASLLILNLQNRFGWSNVSVTALLS